MQKKKEKKQESPIISNDFLWFPMISCDFPWDGKLAVRSAGREICSSEWDLQQWIGTTKTGHGTTETRCRSGSRYENHRKSYVFLSFFWFFWVFGWGGFKNLTEEIINQPRIILITISNNHFESVIKRKRLIVIPQNAYIFPMFPYNFPMFSYIFSMFSYASNTDLRTEHCKTCKCCCSDLLLTNKILTKSGNICKDLPSTNKIKRDQPNDRQA